MSMNNLTIDGEFRYIVQWFKEWSELQRDDFVPILAKYIRGCHINDDANNEEDETSTTSVNMNGLPNELEYNGRPMSLFQCRIKLFNQWNRRWPTEFKEKLQQKISEIDGKVGEKINQTLNPNSSGNLTNGHAAKEQDENCLEQLKVNVDNYSSDVERIVLNDPMVEVLNNETSVDDIEANEDSSNSVEQPLLNNTLQSGDNDVGDDDNANNDNKMGSSNIRYNHVTKEDEDPVEQVVQMQSLKINEENVEREIDHEDAAACEEQKHEQHPLPSVTVTVNPVVTQTIATNAEVPLVA